MKRFVRTLAVAAVAGAGFALPGAPAQAADGAILTAGFQFIPPTVVVAEGDGLQHTNADIAPHNVVSTQVDANNKPLFESPLIGVAKTAAVTGVPDLAAGSYPFFCELHPNMIGTLEVRGSAPVTVPALPPVPDTSAVSSLSVAGVVPTPTSLTIRGTNMYVASYATGSIYELPIIAGGLLGNGTVYASGFSSPLGVEFGPDGTLFVADSHPSARPDRATAGRVWALPAGGGDAAEVGEIVVDELPNGRHNTNGMDVHDGRLFITNGNATDDGTAAGGDGEEPLSGTLLSVDLAARGLVVPAPPAAIPSGITVEAIGMRNVYDVAFRPGTAEAWITVNGPDAFDPYGEDTLVAAPVGDGIVEDFGFPGCLYTADPTLPRVKQNPAVAATHPCGEHVAPKALVGLHVSADGLAFGPDDAYWGGDVFIAEFGNFFGNKIVGHKVLRVPVNADGSTGTPVDFFVGVAPLDLTFGAAGLYVADFATGQITLLRSPA